MLVVMRLGETPVPIPNTMVKPQTADGTALETVWEQVAASSKKEVKEPNWKQAEAFEINFNIDTDMKKGDFMTTRPAGKCC